LHGQRKIGHFVQKEGAFVSGLKQPLLVFAGAGKAAFFVAEKFAFHQLGGNGAAVDGNEGFVGARPQFMNEPGHQFFAGAGLAADVDRGLAAGQFVNLFTKLCHGRGVAKQAAVFG
jgi:hypothetical protein